MFKKFLSIILVFLMCCAASITVFAHSEHLHAEENSASGVSEEYAATDVTGASSGIVTAGDRLAINPDFVYDTITVKSEYLERLHDAPDEILSASTMELLKYFLDTPFLQQQFFVYSTPVKPEIDFSRHKAFRELISRDDFVETLENYAGSILHGLKSDKFDIAGFDEILAQPSVKSIISDSTYSADSYPNLQSIYTAFEVVPSSVGDYVDTINNIRYYSAGTISTANNLNVEVCTPERNLEGSEIAYINGLFERFNNIRLHDPNSNYNCHSYAWYRFSANNPYWIMDISQFLRDSGCTRIEPASAQVKDIIVYADASGIPVLCIVLILPES